MKKLIPAIALLIGAYGAFGQGVVNFRNENLQSLPGDRLIRMPDGTTPVIGTTYTVQLFYGSDPASLAPHSVLAYFRPSLTPGTWSGANRTLANTAAPPPPIRLLVRLVWDRLYGCRFAPEMLARVAC